MVNIQIRIFGSCASARRRASPNRAAGCHWRHVKTAIEEPVDVFADSKQRAGDPDDDQERGEYQPRPAMNQIDQISQGESLCHKLHFLAFL